ncbi:hypothetical protein ACFX1R_003736 [Malus domestica]
MWILYGICASFKGLARSVTLDELKASKSFSSFFCLTESCRAWLSTKLTSSLVLMERSIEPQLVLKRTEVGLTWRRMTASSSSNIGLGMGEEVGDKGWGKGLQVMRDRRRGR